MFSNYEVPTQGEIQKGERSREIKDNIGFYLFCNSLCPLTLIIVYSLFPSFSYFAVNYSLVTIFKFNWIDQ